MQDIISKSISRLKRTRVRRMRIIAILLVLSLVVSLDIFWILRQPGLTLAGDADCMITEHTHDAQCQSGDVPCPLEEHVHSINCYSNMVADVETQLDWQNMFDDYPYTDSLRENLVGIAKTQVGYCESTSNFEVDSSGNRHGYNRYGAWYGAPYNDWSAMFVSFCLHYAGADSVITPGNSGASAMATLWQKLGKYAPAGSYTPTSGDLVFLTDHTVGIITDVYNAIFYVIRGDMDDAVRGSVMFLGDSSIAGFGITEGVWPGDETPPEPEELKTDPLDISNGPAVVIYENGSVQPRMMRYSLRSTPTITDLLPYLEANEGNYFFTLLDKNNQELPKDADGNYIAQANVGYKLTVTFNSPKGFLPGTYQYQVPNGLMVDGGEGTFILKDGTHVGSWDVTDTGLITLEFNEHINSRTDITISATLGIHFPEQEDPINFDGLIFVKVEPPVDQQFPTVLSKWGSPNQEKGKINWTVRIDGYADSQIPGNILTDQTTLESWTRPHSYTQSDIDNGLTFGVSDPDGGWHNWHVSADDPHLIWDENGWSYKIPKTVTCDYCGELELGNEGWCYLINYTSTPTQLNTPGTFDYANKVTIDAQTAWGWSNFELGTITAQIIKNGSFVSDAGGGAFLWELQAVIPGRLNGQRAEYSWFVMDEMRLLDANGAAVGKVHNDVDLAMVLATYNGTTIHIPRIQDATDQDMFAWDNSWSSTENGINATRTLNLLCRCQCTEETCHWDNCGEYWFVTDEGQWATNGFCECWTETQNMTFTFVYRTNDLSMIESYGSLGYQLNNFAQLYYSNDAIRVSWDDATVPIPNLLTKQLTHDFDGYTANYQITVNESKLVLTNGTPLYIHDMMTDTLAYISGSLVITAEDAAGNIVTLQQGVDYTVTYDGTGNKKDDNGKKVHVLDIVILHPQPVKYLLDYDATLIMPEKVTQGIKYSNSATISLWGQDIADTSVEKVYADINIAAKSYRVELHKTAALTGEPLSGALFGLYNQNGGLITSGLTNINGELLFQTSITQGIILREHILYYMQELRAPPGYQLDDTQYWFCFCDEPGDSCTICDEILAGVTAIRIPFEQIGQVHITNELMKYELPATGGPGIYPLVLVGVIAIITPLVYMFIRRRKRERRGVG